VGALCLDAGMDAVENFVSPYLETAVTEILNDQRDKDPKSLLQEIVQAGGKPAPQYMVVAENGPDHAKTFEVEVYANGDILGRGAGSSKHDASMAAAQDALDNLAYI